MKTLSKLFLFAAGFFLALVGISYLILQVWMPFMTLLIGLAVVGILIPGITEYRVILEFMTMRTTKHGLNMGSLILLVLVFLFSINFLSVRFNRTFDLTSDGLNSLSDQSFEVIKKVKEPLVVTMFYPSKSKGGDGRDTDEAKALLKNNLQLYMDRSRQIRLQYVDAYQRIDLAKKYLADQRELVRPIVVVDYQGRQSRIESPYGETEITKSFLQVLKTDRKKVYFLTGHGERDLQQEANEGLKSFSQALSESGYLVETWNFVEKPELPKDAAVLAIIGPQTAMLPAEIELLKQFAMQGGKLLVAADPGLRHNINSLTAEFGIQFADNYIININQLTQMMNRPALAIGVNYSPTSKATEKIRGVNSVTLFDFSSELLKGKAIEGLAYDELIKTTPNSFVTRDLEKWKEVATKEGRILVIAMSAKGSYTPPKSEKKGAADFEILVFGDSDFVSNVGLIQGMNRDLALNLVSYLAKDEDMITIRPKAPKGTQLNMTNVHQLGAILAGIGLPVFLILGGGVIWFRRRGA